MIGSSREKRRDFREAHCRRFWVGGEVRLSEGVFCHEACITCYLLDQGFEEWSFV
jgi:hypothetical protein